MLVIGCQRSAARGKLKKQTWRRRRRVRSCWSRPETLRKSEICPIQRPRSLSYSLGHLLSPFKKQTTKQTFSRPFLVFTEQKAQTERQVLSSDKERVQKPPSLFTLNWPIIHPGFRKFATLHVLQDKLVTYAVMRAIATTDFNLQCNNVARQVEEKCCPYYRTFQREIFFTEFQFIEFHEHHARIGSKLLDSSWFWSYFI